MCRLTNSSRELELDKLKSVSPNLQLEWSRAVFLNRNGNFVGDRVMLARLILGPLRALRPMAWRTGVRNAHTSMISSMLPKPFMPAFREVQKPVAKIASSSTFSIVNEVYMGVWHEPEDNTMYMDSVLRKRRLKMKKHKLRKRRRAQRSLKKRLGKL